MSSDRLVKAGIASTVGLLLLNFAFFPPGATGETDDSTPEHNHEHGYIEDFVSTISYHDVTYTLDEENNTLEVEERFTVRQESPEFEDAVLSFAKQFDHLGNTYELTYDSWKVNGTEGQLSETESHYQLELENIGTEPEEFHLEYTLDGSFFKNQYDGVSTVLFPAVGWEYGNVESSSALLVGVPADSAVSCVPDCDYSPESEGLLFTQTTSPMTLEVFFPPGTATVNTNESELPSSDNDTEEPSPSEEETVPESDLSAWERLDSPTKMLMGVIIVSGLLALLLSRLYFASKRKRRRRKMKKQRRKKEARQDDRTITDDEGVKNSSKRKKKR